MTKGFLWTLKHDKYLQFSALGHQLDAGSQHLHCLLDNYRFEAVIFLSSFQHYFVNLGTKIRCHKPSDKLVCGWKTLDISVC